MQQTVTRVFVAKYSELPERIGQAVKVGEEEIALFRLTNGDVRAIENKSPHPKGGVLSEGLVSGEYVFCPLYDWKISLIDGNVQPPDEGKVKTYAVEVDGDDVYLLL
ncbi:nitrite reductase (NADH) small subunit [Anoxybacillus voinovskiensis]|uniref:Nitrite reductase (NADH) small subunit n=1 Tax=Anoxybacteroides voinovskiense TaxID=230470 RepID=A0A840DW98_9BACL|nr:nitrite reductase small subunit NirD [Anoxybacillus voinovskiensis]MBB4073366.1 nitrite reductase (NADH) small subunit [Anoxybacillus voinovskiensis]GGJ61852.1 assimilatory nitrite reductase [NAD(P)H] small subunit [Anoxybacillus voinovskiensis]